MCNWKASQAQHLSLSQSSVPPAGNSWGLDHKGGFSIGRNTKRICPLVAKENAIALTILPLQAWHNFNFTIKVNKHIHMLCASAIFAGGASTYPRSPRLLEVIVEALDGHGETLCGAKALKVPQLRIIDLTLKVLFQQSACKKETPKHLERL